MTKQELEKEILENDLWEVQGVVYHQSDGREATSEEVEKFRARHKIMDDRAKKSKIKYLAENEKRKKETRQKLISIRQDVYNETEDRAIKEVDEFYFISGDNGDLAYRLATDLFDLDKTRYFEIYKKAIKKYFGNKVYKQTLDNFLSGNHDT